MHPANKNNQGWQTWTDNKQEFSLLVGFLFPCGVVEKMKAGMNACWDIGKSVLYPTKFVISREESTTRILQQ